MSLAISLLFHATNEIVKEIELLRLMCLISWLLCLRRYAMLY